MNIEGFRDKMTAMLFSKGISKVSEIAMSETDINKICEQIQNESLHTNVIKAITSDSLTYPEKKAICEIAERSGVSIYDMYLTAKQETNIDIKDLYKASPYLSQQSAEELRMDVVTHKLFSDEPIRVEHTDASDKNIPMQTADDISL